MRPIMRLSMRLIMRVIMGVIMGVIIQGVDWAGQVCQTLRPGELHRTAMCARQPLRRIDRRSPTQIVLNRVNPTRAAVRHQPQADGRAAHVGSSQCTPGSPSCTLRR